MEKLYLQTTKVEDTAFMHVRALVTCLLLQMTPKIQGLLAFLCRCQVQTMCPNFQSLSKISKVEI